MKKNTIAWRIFKYNIIAISVLLTLTTIVFNITIQSYIENDIKEQLSTIAQRAEATALFRGPDFFLPQGLQKPPILPGRQNGMPRGNNDLFGFYFFLDRSLREPLSILNADFILLDNNMEIITPPEGDYFTPSSEIANEITNKIKKMDSSKGQEYVYFNLNNTDYISIVKPVSDKNSFGLGWLVIYSSLQKVNQLQLGINVILFVIVLLSALIFAIFSSLSAKKISAPFSSLNQHIRAIAERNFGVKIEMPVDAELQELVNSINIMSEKLESYDKAQKTFFQNASHEFRTPLMSIQSYAEGIKYEVVDKNTAADIIIDETKRMTHLVEDLLYLSRLDTIEENYRFAGIDFRDFINACQERMYGIASKSGITLDVKNINDIVMVYADEEKLFRAFTNIIGNCIRYANNIVSIVPKIIDRCQIEVIIRDDGPGIDSNDLPNIFERFYKGKKGNVGLGLAISKNIIERHNGKITAKNSESGAVFTIVLPIKRS
ncbi:MAG TPA: HAMP domain-containing sensor histidine kinase [Acetivibrio sp.]|uniref:sensor histidine kinase n=1 Tax=Acetivibrio sp. TaxID=1872092 RepID=UPI002D0D7C81|nr:HAMP domain-containing sensor histidine kinase [Acetivibrio sp.]HOM02933.1 HAMP domain-containing sensor histidine kinase [Acetivibrio sp.]